VDMIKRIASPRLRARLAGVALLFYNLLKPVNRNVSLLAAVFRLIFVAVMTVNFLNYFGPLAGSPRCVG
jgi:hypothetical protein